MFGNLELLLTQFNREVLIILSGCAILAVGILVFYWLHNRRKFQRLSHQIPASVLKSYLDSIIQNSTALKSSLFRGGGLDLESGIPSVKPVGEIQQSHSSGVSSEELNQKLALIASLESQLSERQKTIADLEKKLSEGPNTPVDNSALEGLQTENQNLKNQIEELKNQKPAAAGGADSTQLESVTKERDDLKDRLKEYEIIEDDLANLKRLQQENEQLRKELEGKGGEASPPPEEAPAEASTEEVEGGEAEPPIEAETPQVEEKVEEAVEETNKEEVDKEEAVAAAAPEGEASESEEENPPELKEDGKSAEDLLTEFEKMLGG